MISRPILFSLEPFLYFALVLPPFTPSLPLYDSCIHGLEMLGCVRVSVCVQECARLGESAVHCGAPLGPARAGARPLGVAVCEDEVVSCPAWPLPGRR